MPRGADRGAPLVEEFPGFPVKKIMKKSASSDFGGSESWENAASLQQNSSEITMSDPLPTRLWPMIERPRHIAHPLSRKRHPIFLAWEGGVTTPEASGSFGEMNS